MAAPVRPTFGSIVYRVAVRLGFGAQGGATAAQLPIIEDFVQSAQEQLIEQYQDTVLRVINDTDPGTLTTGMTLYDIPDNADPDELESFVLLTLEADAAYPPLARGITPAMRALTDRSRPQRYEFREGTSAQTQIELWPPPDADYPARLEYFMRPKQFQDHNDKATVDGRAIFLHALAAAKAHYRQPDAQSVDAQLTALLSKLKRKQHKGRRYFRRGFSSAGDSHLTQVSPKRV